MRRSLREHPVSRQKLSSANLFFANIRCNTSSSELPFLSLFLIFCGLFFNELDGLFYLWAFRASFYYVLQVNCVLRKILSSTIYEYFSFNKTNLEDIYSFQYPYSTNTCIMV